MRMRIWAVGVFIGHLLVGSAALAAVPDAGSTLQTLPAEPAAPTSPLSPLPATPVEPATEEVPGQARVTVARFVIRGAESIPADELHALVREGEGQQLTFAEIEGYARRITRHYRDAGYMLARAYLPEQTIVEGQVEIAVLEGRIDQATLDNKSAIDDALLSRYLGPLAPGAQIRTSTVERQLLLLNDVAGAEVASLLRPGSAIGTSDLVVSVKDAPRFSGSVDASNHGGEATGEARVGVTLNAANLAGLGDRASMRLLTGGERLGLGRLAWEAPVGAGGWRAGAAYTRMGYEVGGQFEPLEAEGDANAYSVWAQYGLVRSARLNVAARLVADRKQLRDVIGVTDTMAKKRLDSGTLRFDGDSNDGWGGGGSNQFGVSFTAGDLDLDPQSLQLDQSPTGRHVSGLFSKANISGSRLQQVGGGVAGYLAFSGQATPDNLDSSEKFSLGGPNAVRAYPNGERASDDAWLVTAELRWKPAAATDLQLVMFADAGGGRLNHDPSPADADNDDGLAGGGAGLRWRFASHWRLDTFAAWRADEAPATEADRHPRVWAQLVGYF